MALTTLSAEAFQQHCSNNELGLPETTYIGDGISQLCFENGEEWQRRQLIDGKVSYGKIRGPASAERVAHGVVLNADRFGEYVEAVGLEKEGVANNGNSLYHLKNGERWTTYNGSFFVRMPIEPDPEAREERQRNRWRSRALSQESFLDYCEQFDLPLEDIMYSAEGAYYKLSDGEVWFNGGDRFFFREEDPWAVLDAIEEDVRNKFLKREDTKNPSVDAKVQGELSSLKENLKNELRKAEDKGWFMPKKTRRNLWDSVNCKVRVLPSIRYSIDNPGHYRVTYSEPFHVRYGDLEIKAHYSEKDSPLFAWAKEERLIETEETGFFVAERDGLDVLNPLLTEALYGRNLELKFYGQRGVPLVKEDFNPDLEDDIGRDPVRTSNPHRALKELPWWDYPESIVKLVEVCHDLLCDESWLSVRRVEK